MTYKGFKKGLLTGTAIVAIGAFSAPAFAQVEITSTDTNAPTAATEGNALNNTTDGAAEVFGSIDAEAITTVTSITAGENGGTADALTRIRILDLSDDMSQDTVTIAGDVILTQDGTPANTDQLVFEVGPGAVDGSGARGVGVIFSGNIDAGANGQIVFEYEDSNAEGSDVTISGATVNFGLGDNNAAGEALGAGAGGDEEGGVRFRNAADTLTFNGGAAQTVTGLIIGATAGDGIVNITNANTTGVTFNQAIFTDVAAINVGTASAAGVAQFDANLTAGALLTVNGTAGASTATYSADVSTTAILLDDGAGAATVAFDEAGAQAVASTIGGATAGEGTVNIIGGTANTATFAGVLGGASGANRLNVVNAGTASTAGNGNFNADVFVNTLNVNATSANSSATFADDLNAATGIVLTDGANAASVSFDGGAAQQITGNVTATVADDGTINIINNDFTATFSGQIGTAMNNINVLNIGTEGGADGQAEFDGAVFARTISVNADQGTSIGNFDSNVTVGAGNFTITDSNAAQAASASVAGNLTGNTVLHAENGGGSATLTFDGGAAQTVTGTIDVSNTTGATTIVVSGTGTSVNFTQNILATAALDDFNINGAAADFDGVIVGIDDVAVNATAGNAQATFSNNATFTALTLTNGGNTATANFDGAAERTIVGQVTAAGGGQGVVNLTNANGFGTRFTTATFANIGDINVGTAAANGIGDFNADLANTGTIDIDATAGNSTANFGGNLAAATISLNDNGANLATAIFDDTAGGATIAATINGASVGEGTISVLNAGQTATFNGVVGATSVGTINVGVTGTRGNADFNGAVTATTLNVNGTAGASSAIFDADVAAAIVLTGTTANSQVIFNDDTSAAAQTVSGSVTAAAANNGSIIVRNDSGTGTTFTGAVGTGNAIGSIVVGDGTAAGDAVFNSTVNALGITVAGDSGASTVDFDGALTLGANKLVLDTNGNNVTVNISANVMGQIDLNTAGAAATATLNLDGGNAFSVGAIDVADTTRTELVDVIGSNTRVTFGGQIGASAALDQLRITDGNTAIFSDGNAANNAISVNATAFNNAGTIQLEDTITLTAGDTLNLASDSAANLVLGSVFTNGTTAIQATAATDVNVGAGNVLTLTLPSSFKSGTLTLVDDAGADAATDAGRITVAQTGSTALATYAVSASGTAIQVTATAKTAAQTASDLNLDQTAAANLATASSAGTGNATVQSFLDGVLNSITLGSVTAAQTKAVEDAVEQIIPDSQSAAAATADTAAAIVTGGASSIGARVASLRGNDNRYASAGTTGVAAGDAFSTGHFWLEGNAGHVDQDIRQGVDGYSAGFYGLTAGVDTLVSDNVTLGLAFTYGYTDVEGDSAADSNSNVDTYQLSLYGDYDMGDMYVTGQLGYGISSVDTNALIAADRKSGDFDLAIYSAALSAGKELVLNDKVNFIPRVGAQYIHFGDDTYRMTGAVGASDTNESIESKDALLLSVGGQLEGDFAMEGGVFTPDVSLDVIYDAIAEASQSSRTFTGATTITNTAPDVAETALNMGVGLAYTTDDGMTELSAGYDAEVKSDYFAHTGSVKVKFKF